eukprot:359264-Chlamydomonas_euryale.AAC.2
MVDGERPRINPSQTQGNDTNQGITLRSDLDGQFAVHFIGHDSEQGQRGDCSKMPITIIANKGL